jgi:hypothetical protein
MSEVKNQVWVIHDEDGEPINADAYDADAVEFRPPHAVRYVPEASAQGEAGRLSEGEAVSLLTEAMRAADQAFERVGGSTRHHVRDCLIPELERRGLAVVRSARLEPVARWVDQTERMPPIGATVIVLRHGVSEPIAAQLDDDGDWVDAATHEIRRVTHWMPLPAAPLLPHPPKGSL